MHVLHAVEISIVYINEIPDLKKVVSSIITKIVTKNLETYTDGLCTSCKCKLLTLSTPTMGQCPRCDARQLLDYCAKQTASAKLTIRIMSQNTLFVLTSRENMQMTSPMGATVIYTPFSCTQDNKFILSIDHSVIRCLLHCLLCLMNNFNCY